MSTISCGSSRSIVPEDEYSIKISTSSSSTPYAFVMESTIEVMFSEFNSSSRFDFVELIRATEPVMEGATVGIEVVGTVEGTKLGAFVTYWEVAETSVNPASSKALAISSDAWTRWASASSALIENSTLTITSSSTLISSIIASGIISSRTFSISLNVSSIFKDHWSSWAFAKSSELMV